MTKRPTQLSGSEKVVVRRLVPATRAEVYELWTDAERMPEWILDGGSATLDVRPGGKFHLDMHYEGKSYPHDGEYLELRPPEKLVFTWLSQSTNWKPSIVTVELFERDGQTEIVLTHEGLPDLKSAMDHEAGWTEILGWLSQLVTRRVRSS